MPVSREQLLAQIADESTRLLATDASQLLFSIPHIEAWTVGDVLGHTGWVARYATLLQTSTPENPPARSAIPNPPAGADVLAWASEGLQNLGIALAESDPEVMRPSFAGPQKAQWWVRRMAHELSMHRWDVAAASGTPDPIDSAISVDGIDEIFDVFVPIRMRFETLGGTGEVLHLHSTEEGDGTGEWTATLHPDRIDWDHSHTKGDVAVRGTASNLLLMLWSRIPASRLEVFGSAAIIDRWQEAAAF